MSILGSRKLDEAELQKPNAKVSKVGDAGVPLAVPDDSTKLVVLSDLVVQYRAAFAEWAPMVLADQMFAQFVAINAASQIVRGYIFKDADGNTVIGDVVDQIFQESAQSQFRRTFDDEDLIVEERRRGGVRRVNTETRITPSNRTVFWFGQSVKNKILVVTISGDEANAARADTLARKGPLYAQAQVVDERALRVFRRATYQVPHQSFEQSALEWRTEAQANAEPYILLYNDYEGVCDPLIAVCDVENAELGTESTHFAVAHVPYVRVTDLEDVDLEILTLEEQQRERAKLNAVPHYRVAKPVEAAEKILHFVVAKMTIDASQVVDFQATSRIRRSKKLSREQFLVKALLQLKSRAQIVPELYVYTSLLNMSNWINFGFTKLTSADVQLDVYTLEAPALQNVNPNDDDAISAAVKSRFLKPQELQTMIDDVRFPI